MTLLAGGNDLADTMFSDDVTADAGATDADYLDPAVMERMVSDLGRTLKERTPLYELIRRTGINCLYLFSEVRQ